MHGHVIKVNDFAVPFCSLIYTLLNGSFELITSGAGSWMGGRISTIEIDTIE
jgi:hypothetical protein